MKFSPKCRVLCQELKQDRRQLKKGRGAAGKGKRGRPPLHIGLAGALGIFTGNLVFIKSTNFFECWAILHVFCGLWFCFFRSTFSKKKKIFRENH